MLEGLLGSLKGIDATTTTLLTRFLMRAVKSGNANQYIQERIQRALDEDDKPKVEVRQGSTRITQR